jgi:hypothetical protein
MLRTGFEIKVTILNTDNTKRPLAAAELVFKDGPLEGINLEGFAIWANKEEDGFNVTFPSKPTNGAKGKYYRPLPSHDQARAHHHHRVHPRRVPPRGRQGAGPRGRRRHRLTHHSRGGPAVGAAA